METEPQILTAVQPRPPQDVADLAVAVQANVVQLQAADRRQSGPATPLLDIRVPSSGAVTRFREALISREVIAAYDDVVRSLRAHEAWGQFCLFCWFFFVDDPAGVAIVNVNVAGTPSLPMGVVAVTTPDASAAVKRR